MTTSVHAWPKIGDKGKSMNKISATPSAFRLTSNADQFKGSVYNTSTVRSPGVYVPTDLTMDLQSHRVVIGRASQMNQKSFKKAAMAVTS